MSAAIQTTIGSKVTAFLAKGNFQYLSLLTYGGLGLTLQFRYPEQPSLDLVVKVSLRDTVDEEISTDSRGALHLAKRSDENRNGRMRTKSAKIFSRISQWQGADGLGRTWFMSILIQGIAISFDPLAEDGERDIIPRLKLADFGCARDIKPNKGNLYYLERRRFAKAGHCAPGQFGVEWEYIAPTEPHGWELSEQRVAGNHGPWTNVLGIALTMWQLITRFLVPEAPQSQETDGPDDPITYCMLPLTHAIREGRLRTLADDCTMDLLWRAGRNVSEYVPGEFDDMIGRWVQRVVLDASDESDSDSSNSDGSSGDDSPGDAPGGDPPDDDAHSLLISSDGTLS
ncbi:hypothetical protein F5Y13DRAFT_184526 [Hypoxylon sp. FL1857]|nr:hypothetical protein F5Y13DRAFT_184526 [Hypoxylon sp. FL1857]